ncbi:hypothetical protein C8F01DRAFT_1258999 [Mycena amicta]|nr:hypothetical protein C8F01DRAFT_1258999 [Mycena amicta]
MKALAQHLPQWGTPVDAVEPRSLSSHRHDPLGTRRNSTTTPLLLISIHHQLEIALPFSSTCSSHLHPPPICHPRRNDRPCCYDDDELLQLGARSARSVHTKQAHEGQGASA